MENNKETHPRSVEQAPKRPCIRPFCVPQSKTQANTNFLMDKRQEEEKKKKKHLGISKSSLADSFIYKKTRQQNHRDR